MTANALSLTDASGWSNILMAFASSGTKISPIDMLPFPEEIRHTKRMISARTAKVLLQLKREELLPERTQIELGQFIKEAEVS
jgi:hypothetical protein